MTPELEKLVDEKLSEMVNDEPMKFIRFMLIIMGQMCVEANAETMNLNQESTFNKVRYEVKCKITVKKVNK